MLDWQTTIMLLGLIVLATIGVMVLVRPSGPPRQYSRSPYGRAVSSAIRSRLKRRPAQTLSPPPTDEGEVPDRRTGTM